MSPENERDELNSVISCLTRSFRFIKLTDACARLRSKFLEIAGLKEMFISGATYFWNFRFMVPCNTTHKTTIKAAYTG
jgi:hypothetical protein